MNENNNEKNILQLTALLVSTNVIPPAYAEGDGDLWAAVAVLTCLEQDPVNQDTTVDKKFTSAPEYAAQVKAFSCIALK